MPGFLLYLRKKAQLSFFVSSDHDIQSRQPIFSVLFRLDPFFVRQLNQGVQVTKCANLRQLIFLISSDPFYKLDREAI